MKTVDLIYFNAGGGHRAAALALERVMQGEHWQVRLVNLVDMLDPHEQFRKYTGVAPEDLYNKRLASGFLYVGSPVKQVRELSEKEKAFFTYSAGNYVKLKDQHLAEGYDQPV